MPIISIKMKDEVRKMSKIISPQKGKHRKEKAKEQTDPLDPQEKGHRVCEANC